MPPLNYSKNSFYMKVDDQKLADEIVELCENNGITVDFETGEGAYQAFWTKEKEKPDIVPVFPSSDIDFTRPEDRQLMMSYAGIFRHAAEKNQLYFYKDNENYPRKVSRNESTGKLELGEQLTGIPEPKKPGYFKSLLHSLNANWFKADFDAYVEKMAEVRAANGRLMSNAETRERVRAEKQEQKQKEQEALSRKQEAAPEQELVSEAGKQILNQQIEEAENRKLRQGISDENEYRKKRQLDEIAYKNLKQQISDTLDKAFEKQEKNKYGFNRNHFITINGRSVMSFLRENYLKKEPSGDNFVPYLASPEGKAASLNLLSAAVLMNKHIELFPRDGRGNLPERPLLLEDENKTEYSPEFIKSITGSAGRSGNLTEEDKKRIEESRELIRGRAYLLQIEENLPLETKMKSKLFAEWEKKNGRNATKIKNPLNLSTSRGAVSSFTVGYLLSKGLAVEDVFDPEKSLAEIDPKAPDYVAEVIDHIEKGDAGWLAEQNCKEREMLCDYLDEASKNLDVTDSAKLFAEKNKMMFIAGFTAFDLDQEETHIKPQVEAYFKARYGNKGPEKMAALGARVNTWAADSRLIVEGRLRQIDLASGTSVKESDLDEALKGAFLQQLYAKLQKEKPKTRKSELLNADQLGVGYALSAMGMMLKDNPTWQELTDKAKLQNTAKKLLKGKLSDFARIDINPDTLELSCEPPEKPKLQHRQESMVIK